MLPRKIAIWLGYAIDNDLRAQERAIVFSIENIADLAGVVYVFVTVGEGFDGLGLPKECLETRDDRKVHEEAPSSSRPSIPWLFAVWAAFMVLESAKKCCAGVDTAFVVDGIDSGKHSEAVCDDPLGLNSHLVAVGVSHLVECLAAHVAHDF